MAKKNTQYNNQLKNDKRTNNHLEHHRYCHASVIHCPVCKGDNISNNYYMYYI